MHAGRQLLHHHVLLILTHILALTLAVMIVGAAYGAHWLIEILAQDHGTQGMETRAIRDTGRGCSFPTTCIGNAKLKTSIVCVALVLHLAAEVSSPSGTRLTARTMPTRHLSSVFASHLATTCSTVARRQIPDEPARCSPPMPANAAPGIA